MDTPANLHHYKITVLKRSIQLQAVDPTGQCLLLASAPYAYRCFILIFLLHLSNLCKFKGSPAAARTLSQRRVTSRGPMVDQDSLTVFLSVCVCVLSSNTQKWCLPHIMQNALTHLNIILIFMTTIHLLFLFIISLCHICETNTHMN